MPISMPKRTLNNSSGNSEEAGQHDLRADGAGKDEAE